jgi:hypothetical protein
MGKKFSSSFYLSIFVKEQFFATLLIVYAQRHDLDQWKWVLGHAEWRLPYSSLISI